MALSAKDLLSQDDFWAFVFAFGAVMLNWPILSLVVGKSAAFGVPPVLVYITSIWLLIILLLYLFDRRYSG